MTRPSASLSCKNITDTHEDYESSPGYTLLDVGFTSGVYCSADNPEGTSTVENIVVDVERKPLTDEYDVSVKIRRGSVEGTSTLRDGSNP